MKKFTKIIKTIYWRILAFCAVYYYGNPTKKLKIIGVTGTSGKTTTATLLYRISMALGYKSGLIGTTDNLINDQKIETGHGPGTTPDSVSLTKIFAQMVRAGCEYVFIEVSSHSVVQKRVAHIYFTLGIFTNLSQDHLDYHKDMEDYFQAKKGFFKMLSKEAAALSNTDDEHGNRMLKSIQTRKFSYGLSGGEDFHGEIKKLDSLGLELKFNNSSIHSKLLGKFNVYNLLAVWSTCNLLGFNMSKVNKILENVEPPRGRFEHFTSGNGVLAIVDYAHKPDALEKILAAIKETKMTSGRIISVFGCGGDRDPFKRPIMGKIGVQNSDICIFTSDNPRSENPDAIIAQMKTNLTPDELKKVITIPNRREAILQGVKLAKTGDILLLAGKGHEDYQEIRGVKTHFDDMEELKKAFS